MTKHTQGPWTYWPDCAGEGGRITQDGTAQHIAAPTLYFKREQTEANARLMAAAPELLEALKIGYADTMDYIQSNHLSGSENNQWLVLARAAIAKATGETE